VKKLVNLRGPFFYRSETLEIHLSK